MPRPLRTPALAPVLLAAAMAAQPAAAEPASCRASQQAAATQHTQLQGASPRLQALLLGEIHDNPADHAWQLQTLAALRHQPRPLILGLEMVPAARQPVLDRWNSGAIDANALLEQVGWQEVWGHDPQLYLPLLSWARLQGIPLLALNAEPALVRQVHREGLASIPAAQRANLRAAAAVSPAERLRLERSWREHSGSQGPLPPAQQAALERFISSQRLRDRTMAQQIAAAQRQSPNRLVVALIGQGHLENGDGVPRQLRALGINRVLSLTRIAPADGCAIAPAPGGARLGAYLESEDSRVWVRQVAPGSAAAAAGLRPGDRIVSVNGRAVDRAGQVIRAVRLHPDGTPLVLTIERQGRSLQLPVPLPPRPASAQANGHNAPSSSPAAAPAA